MKDKKIYTEILSYIIIIILALLIRSYCFTFIIVNGGSMENTLFDNDIMFLDKFSYHFNDIERFDIVVSRDSDGYIIKRVIGLPGDIINCNDGDIYINGKKIDDKYSEGVTYDFPEIMIGKDEYFLMGDNRESSLDSRKLGSFSKDEILGKTSFVLFPFNRFGNVK